MSIKLLGWGSLAEPETAEQDPRKPFPPSRKIILESAKSKRSGDSTYLDISIYQGLMWKRYLLKCIGGPNKTSDAATTILSSGEVDAMEVAEVHKFDYQGYSFQLTMINILTE